MILDGKYQGNSIPYFTTQQGASCSSEDIDLWTGNVTTTMTLTLLMTHNNNYLSVLTNVYLPLTK